MRRALLLPLALLLLTEAPPIAGKRDAPLRLPWREAGLSEPAAASHLLDRLAFGARPGEVERVVAMGLEAWVARQLAADLPDPALAADLARYDALTLAARKMVETYPSPGLVLTLAREAGVVPRDSRRAPGAASTPRSGPASGGEPASTSPVGAGAASGDIAADLEQREQRRKVMEWARSQGYRSQRELIGQLLSQKVVRAVESENQLAEVLVDFWSNHFNVSMTDNEARGWILAYERDAIRPHILGSFPELLEATAKHPAMLLYLDNFRSVAAEGQPTTLQREMERLGGPGGMRGGTGGRRGGGGMGGGMRPPGGGFDGGMGGGMRPPMGTDMGGDSWPGDELGLDPGTRAGRGGRGGARAAGRPRSPQGANRPQGLNENYARELLELHTLGVDGGYSQEDVIEVARALTGWSLRMPGRGRERAERALEGARRAGGLGFREEGDFLFRADQHDAAAKSVLGHKLAAGRGLEDGEQVLDLVAAHPATARHLARKLATRFVADEPPASLVERLAAVFTATGGDLREVMRALVESPEFWAESARRQKIKSPLELAASALRALGARLEEPRGIIAWIARMGQPLYAYQAPTGFPDRADHWVNSGSLLSRMNFTLELATGRVAGVRFDLAALAALPAVDAGREPESAEAALSTYARLLLPERDLEPTLRELAPLAADPELGRKLAERAPVADTADSADTAGAGAGESESEMAMLFGFDARPERPRRRDRAGEAMGDTARRAAEPPSTAASVVALVLGSPEFQRR